MLKLKLKDAPEPRPVKIKLRANRAQVEGYDAEAPDREDDPTIEEAIVLRLLPNIPAVEQLHRACETNDFSQVSVKFEERRKAIVSICGEDFHAQLLDLPTVTEVHKTVDKRNIFKTISVSQILLVTHNVRSPPPDMSAIARLAPDAQSYPHGITPPMHNVRNRRFQQRMSNKAIESIENKVEELLKRDALAKEVQTELLPASAVAAQQAFAEAARAAAARAHLEESDDMEVDDELDEEFERAMLDDSQDESMAETGLDGISGEPGSGRSGSGNVARNGSGSDPGSTIGASSTSAGGSGSGSGSGMGSQAAHSSSDEEDDDDDDDDDDDERGGDGGDDDDDDDDEVSHQSSRRLREEVRELLETISAKERVARTVVNDIMRARHMDAVNRLRSELEKKQRLLNEADENAKAPVMVVPEEEEEEDDDEDDDEDEAPAPGAADQLQDQQEQAVSAEAEPQQLEETMPAETDQQFANLGERLEDALRGGDDDDIDSLF